MEKALRGFAAHGGIAFCHRAYDIYAVRRLPLILTLLAISGLSTGGLDFLHQQQHRQQMDQWLAAVRATAIKHGRLPAQPPLAPKSDPNCAICQALHSPVTAQFSTTSIPKIEPIEIATVQPPLTVFAERIPLPMSSRAPPLA